MDPEETVQATQLSAAISKARGNTTREAFCGRIGCGMSSLRRWEDGMGRPTSEAHKRELAKAGVPRQLLDGQASTGGAAA